MIFFKPPKTCCSRSDSTAPCFISLKESLLKTAEAAPQVPLNCYILIFPPKESFAALVSRFFKHKPFKKFRKGNVFLHMKFMCTLRHKYFLQLRQNIYLQTFYQTISFRHMIFFRDFSDEVLGRF